MLRSSLLRSLFLITGLTLLVGNLTAAAGHAQVPTTTRVSFAPDQDRYPRGQWITVVATVRENWYGCPVAGMPVYFRYTSDGGGGGIGTAYTNGNGQAFYPFQVPTNPAKDNVYVRASFGDGWWAYPWGEWVYLYASEGSRRIPIGR